jgi:hypothetical protein
VSCDGGFTFTGQATGSAFGDFFAGALDTFSDIGFTHDNERWNYIGLYAQDTWKITSRLTANYCLRWEPYLAGSFEYGWVTHFSQADFNANVHSTVYPNAPAGTLWPHRSGSLLDYREYSGAAHLDSGESVAGAVLRNRRVARRWWHGQL